MRTFWFSVSVILAGSAIAQAAVLDISIGAQGVATYNTMVADVKLRGDGGLGDWNLGAGSDGTNRFYGNTLDGTNPSGRQNNFLQRFNVSAIPAGSIITSATLTTVMGAGNMGGTRTLTDVKLSRVLAGNTWVETFQTPPGVNGPHYDGSVTWNNRISLNPGATPWGTAGATGAADIDTGASQQMFTVTANGGQVSVVRDITTWVQSWVNSPASNNGMLWWAGYQADSSRYFHFGTKEDGNNTSNLTDGRAPSLVIEYTLVPEPTAALLLVAGMPLVMRRRNRSEATA